jgi:hypothetical protein
MAGEQGSTLVFIITLPRDTREDQEQNRDSLDASPCAHFRDSWREKLDRETRQVNSTLVIFPNKIGGSDFGAFQTLRFCGAFQTLSRLQSRIAIFGSPLSLGWECPKISHTFSAFWLRSSVVSVLISLISDTLCIA